jgi:hypothetical protein
MRVFADQNLEFDDKLGRKPFVLKHNLAECELFDLARLEDLGTAVIRARRDGRAREALVTVFDAEAASVESWTPEDRSKSTPARVVNKLESTAANAVKISPEVQLTKAFRRINDKEFRSWIKLTSVNEVDLDYDAIRRQAGDLRVHGPLSSRDHLVPNDDFYFLARYRNPISQRRRAKFFAPASRQQGRLPLSSG